MQGRLNAILRHKTDMLYSIELKLSFQFCIKIVENLLDGEMIHQTGIRFLFH